MPALVHGIKNQSIPQPTEKGQVGKDGVHQVTRQEYIPANRFVLKTVGTEHPTFPTLKLSRISYNLTHAGTFYLVDYLFEGTIDEKLPDPTYTIGTTVREEPIETHPKFETELTGLGGKPSAPLNAAIFVDSSGKPTNNDEKGVFDRFGRGKYHGVTSYRERGVTFTEVISQLNRPTAAAKVGKISTPPTAAPTLEDLANWMLVSEQIDKRGGLYQITRTWEASGPKGWDEDIYS
jgi:hypothetical protein